MKYQFITGVHGNEPMPTLALANAGVSQIVANPEALAKSVRFIEKDLNSSFGSEGESLEEKRARVVASRLDSGLQVIDFHTFSAISEPFVVIVDLNMLSLARSVGLKNVVYMKHNIKNGKALINMFKGVSVEVGQHADPRSFTLTNEVLEHLNKGKTVKVRLFEVFDIITAPGKYLNFKKFKGGFYPVLAGENAYNHYGLKAKLISGD